MDFYQLAAFFAGTIGAVAGVPQVIKLIKLKESKEISVVMYLLILLTQVTWIIYGWHKNDYALVVPNLIAGTLVITILFLIRKYRND